MKHHHIAFSKHNKHILILETDPCSKSFAASVLLKYEYMLLTLDNEEWRQRVLFSRNFLHDVLKKEHDLVCTYCGKKNLIIEEDGQYVKQHHKATIDHVLPISKGGGVYNIKNLVVACGTCNTKKDNMTLMEFLTKFKSSLNPNYEILKRFLEGRLVIHDGSCCSS